MRSYLGLGFLSLVVAAGIAGCSADVESLFASGAAGGLGGQGGAGGGKGGAGQGGQGGQGGAAVSSSSAAQGTGPSSSSAASGQGGAGGFDPQVCGQCAFGACQAEIFACGLGCQDFITCAQSCGDKPCVDACLAQYPQAQPTYECTCASCAADCGGLCSGGAASSSSGAGGAGGGGPACSTCSQIIGGQGNDPPCAGSDQLLGALFQCTCQQSCTTECGASCQSGGQPSQACFGCVQTNCGAELNACFQD